MIDELTMRRLAMVKCLYKQGIELSYQAEPNNGFCLLSFQDSVEMFLHLCAENVGVHVNQNTKFLDYFKEIPQLQYQSQMEHLNRTRVALKHHGINPSNIDVEISRVNVTEFFRLNTPEFFGVDFDGVSLVSVIGDEKVRNELFNAEKSRLDGEYMNAVVYAHQAFWMLLENQHKDFEVWFNSMLTASPEIEKLSRINPHFEQHFDRELEKHTEHVMKALNDIDEAVLILGMGIDYKKFCLFRSTAPIRTLSPVEKDFRYIANHMVKYTEKTAQFCFDFVIDAALKMQRLKCDINDFIEKPY